MVATKRGAESLRSSAIYFQSPFRRGNGCYKRGMKGNHVLGELSVPFSSGNGCYYPAAPSAVTAATTFQSPFRRGQWLLPTSRSVAETPPNAETTCVLYITRVIFDTLALPCQFQTAQALSIQCSSVFDRFMRGFSKIADLSPEHRMEYTEPQPSLSKIGVKLIRKAPLVILQSPRLPAHREAHPASRLRFTLLQRFRKSTHIFRRKPICETQRF